MKATNMRPTMQLRWVLKCRKLSPKAKMSVHDPLLDPPKLQQLWVGTFTTVLKLAKADGYRVRPQESVDTVVREWRDVPTERVELES